MTASSNAVPSSCYEWKWIKNTFEIFRFFSRTRARRARCLNNLFDVLLDYLAIFVICQNHNLLVKGSKKVERKIEKKNEKNNAKIRLELFWTFSCWPLCEFCGGLCITWFEFTTEISFKKKSQKKFKKKLEKKRTYIVKSDSRYYFALGPDSAE